MGSDKVYAEFTNLDIDCWKHEGKLGLSEPCICMKASAESIEPLLGAIEQLTKSPGIRSLSLTFREFDRTASITKLTLRLTPASDELVEMCLSQQGSTAEFEFTQTGIDQFRSALETWRGGVSDFSCHPNLDKANKHRKQTGIAPRDLQSGEVWFWSPSMDP